MPLCKNEPHECLACDIRFESGVDSAHTKAFLHYKKMHDVRINIVCFEKCTHIAKRLIKKHAKSLSILEQYGD